MVLKVKIASDHAGFQLKQKVISTLEDMKISTHDLGPASDDRVDYPDFANALCAEWSDDSFGILICGSGQGMAMRANKFSHIRAALCWNEETAKLARSHNDANVLCLGSRVMDPLLITNIIVTFLNTKFEGGRHSGRVKKIGKHL